MSIFVVNLTVFELRGICKKKYIYPHVGSLFTIIDPKSWVVKTKLLTYSTSVVLFTVGVLILSTWFPAR